jgi:hypothetical protein
MGHMNIQVQWVSEWFEFCTLFCRGITVETEFGMNRSLIGQDCGTTTIPDLPSGS